MIPRSKARVKKAKKVIDAGAKWFDKYQNNEVYTKEEKPYSDEMDKILSEIIWTLLPKKENYTMERVFRYNMCVGMIKLWFSKEKMIKVIKYLKKTSYEYDWGTLNSREIMFYYSLMMADKEQVVIIFYGEWWINCDIMLWNDFYRNSSQYLSSEWWTVMHLNKVMNFNKVNHLQLKKVKGGSKKLFWAWWRLYDLLKDNVFKEWFVRFEIVPYKKGDFMVSAIHKLSKEEVDKPSEIYFKNGSYEIKVDEYYRCSGTKTIKNIVNFVQESDVENDNKTII